MLNMPEYIDRKKFMDKLREKMPYLYATVGEIAYGMDEEKIIECKACKHSEQNGGDCNGTLPITYRNYVCEINETKYIRLDYCSYGEPKESECEGE